MTAQDSDLTWANRDAPWWVKLRRAGAHIREAATSIEELHRTRSWRVDAEPGDQPNVVAYRLHIDRQPPKDLLAILGDAIHNLRSALDAAAFGLAEQHLGNLTPAQERATYFPICEDEAAFQRFAKSTRVSIKIEELYGSKGIAALEAVQPFSIAAEGEALGVERFRTRQDELREDAGYRLDVLWNVDKHRRLPSLVWFYKGMACFEKAGACRQVTPNRSLFADGQILARHHFPGAEDVRSDIHAWSVDLTLSDDPFGFPVPLIPMLEGWQQYLGGWVIPRMFYTAETGGPPPMGIGGGWPYTEGS